MHIQKVHSESAVVPRPLSAHIAPSVAGYENLRSKMSKPSSPVKRYRLLVLKVGGNRRAAATRRKSETDLKRKYWKQLRDSLPHSISRRWKDQRLGPITGFRVGRLKGTTASTRRVVAPRVFRSMGKGSGRGSDQDREESEEEELLLMMDPAPDAAGGTEERRECVEVSEDRAKRVQTVRRTRGRRCRSMPV